VTSVGEVRLALEQSCEFLRDAYRSVREAQTALDEAVDILLDASADHHESLVPPGFLAAGERFADELELIVGSLELVQRLAVEL
jgi:exonuclease VII small subunit